MRTETSSKFAYGMRMCRMSVCQAFPSPLKIQYPEFIYEHKRYHQDRRS